MAEVSNTAPTYESLLEHDRHIGSLAGGLAARLDELLQRGQADQVYGLSHWSGPPPYDLDNSAVFSAARSGFEYSRDYTLRVLRPDFYNPSDSHHSAYVELGMHALMGSIYPENVLLRRHEVGKLATRQASDEDLQAFETIQFGELFDPRTQKVVRAASGELEIAGYTKIERAARALRRLRR